MRLPRTYAQLAAAPWCSGFEKPGSDMEYCHIYLDPAWLPEDRRGELTAWGTTLRAAIEHLQRDFWPHLKEPP